MDYAKSNKATWKHDEFRCEVLKEYFKGMRLRDITPRSDGGSDGAFYVFVTKPAQRQLNDSQGVNPANTVH
jgi:hypothetical protein